MQRRSFMASCGLAIGALAANPSLALAAEMSPRRYRRVRLVDDSGAVLRASAIEPGSQLVFHYPYSATPCFLLRLDRPVPGHSGLRTEQGESYSWQGGVGPERSLVAYSAICAHKMTHPTPAVSHIAFRPRRSEQEPAGGVIICCSENSRYDPLHGATVLSGPARQPLAAILLEHDPATDALYAYGTLGGEMFERFFKEFERRLSLQYPDGAAATASGDVVAVPLDRYSANVVHC